MTDTRALAALIINRVIQSKESLTTALSTVLKEIPHSTERAFIQEISYGVLRWYFRLKLISQKLLHEPLRQKDNDIDCLLLIGLYQLIYLNTPDYAAVSTTVGATRSLKKIWAKGLINKTLRLFLSQKEYYLREADKTSEGHYAHPTWLIDRLKQSWPDYWKNILTANNDRPPFFLRVNLQKISRDHYLKLLKENHIEAESFGSLPETIRLPQPLPVDQLPGFDAGLCYVQDAAGQYAAHLLDIEDNQIILDACAAPGSKTTHILELSKKIKKLVVIDSNASRLSVIENNIERLGLKTHHLQILCANAERTEDWWNSELFDRILLDAPCSATGVIRRHPDIKILRTPKDIEQHHNQQFRLLMALWPLLKPNGILLYSTCSILPIENEAVIARFLSINTDAHVDRFDLPGAVTQTHGKQILPGDGGMDGFYYARMRKFTA